MIRFDCNPLGLVTGEGGQLDILPGVVKILDVAFISWAKFPEERLPRRLIPSLIPDLAVEVLSETNTRSEMARKLERYFESGVCLVGYIDPPSRTACAYTSPQDMTSIATDGVLEGGDVLPGFQLSLASESSFILIFSPRLLTQTYRAFINSASMHQSTKKFLVNRLWRGGLADIPGEF